MGQSQDKRRDSARIPLDSNIWVRDTVDDCAPLTHGKLRNVSLGGLKFVAEEPFGQNSFLDMMIDTGHGLVRAWGRVSHEIPIDGNGVETGVAFFEFDLYAQQAISRIIAHNA